MGRGEDRAKLAEKLAAQVTAWQDFAATRVREDDPSRTQEEKYRALRAAAPDDIDPLLSALDPRHTLELDLARQSLTSLAPEIFTARPHLQTLQEIIASLQDRYPRARLCDLCTFVKGRFPIQATPEGPYQFVVTAEEKRTANDFQFDGEAVCIPLISSTGHGHASMKRVHYARGKFAVANLLVALFAKDANVINIRFLFYFLTPKLEELFVPLMKGAANVSMRIEDAMNVEIPLPPIDEQHRFVQEIVQLEDAAADANRRLRLKTAEAETFWER